jgi:hypothetical protein
MRRNIDLQSVRPADLKPAESDSGENLRWAHRAQPYVPSLANRSVSSVKVHQKEPTRG